MSKFVAVVYCEPSMRPEGDLACFVAETKDGAVKRGLRARKWWSERRGSLDARYRVLVGELTEEAVEPVSWELLPLSDKEA